MIFRWPERGKRETDGYGPWRWVWCRRIGPWLVVCQWLRCEPLTSGDLRITGDLLWRRPDNVMLGYTKTKGKYK